MVLLSDVPEIPSEEELERLGAVFFTSFKQHILLAAVDMADSFSNLLPPYLQLAIACLGSAISCSQDINVSPTATDTIHGEESANIFFTGVNLWSVMLEVDNRETRLLEAVVAVSFVHSNCPATTERLVLTRSFQASLFVTYGNLSANRDVRRKSSGVLCNVVTVSTYWCHRFSRSDTELMNVPDFKASTLD